MVTLRQARPSDAYDIVRINADAWREAYAGIVPDDVLAAIDVDGRAKRYERRMAGDRTHETMVATGDGRTVGYVLFGPYREGESLDSSIGEVCAIYVDPRSWGGGVGRVLMAAALERLTALGYPQVRLWVLEANEPARGFYAHLGFRPDGGRSTFAVRRSDGTVVDLPEVRYAWRAA